MQRVQLTGVSLYKELAPTVAPRAGYFRACRSAEFIQRYKQSPSLLNPCLDITYDRINSNSVTYCQFQFPLHVCFYGTAEVK